MTIDERLDDIDRKITKVKRGGDVQTFFLVLVFVFGVTSISQLISNKKTKNNF
jgi:hypothetical protein